MNCGCLAAFSAKRTLRPVTEADLREWRADTEMWRLLTRAKNMIRAMLDADQSDAEAVRRSVKDFMRLDPTRN